jgi:hypothetical protein
MIMRWGSLAERARGILHPGYSPGEMLRLCRRSSVLGEIYSVVGEKCFARLMDVFAGLTVSFPNKAALEKMCKNRQFLNGLSDERQAFPRAR